MQLRASYFASNFTNLLNFELMYREWMVSIFEIRSYDVRRIIYKSIVIFVYFIFVSCIGSTIVFKIW